MSLLLWLFWSASRAARADDVSDVETVGINWLTANVYGGSHVLFDSYRMTIYGAMYALVTYNHGESYGELLLRNNAGSWVVVLKGAGRINRQMLQNEGMSAAAARSLLTPCTKVRRSSRGAAATVNSRVRPAKTGKVGYATTGMIVCRNG